jgi:elongation factor Tu
LFFLFLIIYFTMSAAFRSVAPFLRTARHGLRNGRVNPLQSAFKPQNTSGMLNIYRSYAAVFERTKPHVNIGMIMRRHLYAAAPRLICF